MTNSENNSAMLDCPGLGSTGQGSTGECSTVKKPGFTDRLAMYCVGLITIGLGMAFVLALYSIETGYMGSLACFTVVFTPIGTMLGIVLTAVVGKNKSENTMGGINYAKFMNEEV